MLLKRITDSVLLFIQTEHAQQVAKDFSDRGLYYFDADDGIRIEFVHFMIIIQNNPIR